MQAEAGAALSSEAQHHTSGSDEPRQTASSDPAASSAKPAGASRRRVLMLSSIAVTAYAADQLSKTWAVASLRTGEQHQVIGELLQLRRTANPGAAFSIATNATWVLTIIASCVIIATIYLARRLRSRGWAAALGLLIGGALGNLTDRFFREPGGGQGHVVDFLELPSWPIFNVADICIVSAAVLICLLSFRGIAVDGSRLESTKGSSKGAGPEDDQPSPDTELDEPGRRP